MGEVASEMIEESLRDALSVENVVEYSNKANLEILNIIEK